MDIKSLPKLQSQTQTDRITIPLDKQLKQKLFDLKVQHRINVAEAVRLYLRELVKSVETSSKRTG